MARLDYGVAEDGSGGTSLAPLVERIVRDRGRLVNLHRMLLHSPPIMAGFLELGNGIRFNGSLDGRARELAICRVGQLNGADYEWNHHAPIARREGVSDAQLAALAAWAESDEFDARDRAILAYADAMTREVVVPADVFAVVQVWFEPRDVLELTATIAFYNMVSRILVALEIDDESP